MRTAALKLEDVQAIIQRMEESNGQESPVQTLAEEYKVKPLTIMKAYNNEKYALFHRGKTIWQLAFMPKSRRKKAVSQDVIQDVIVSLETAHDTHDKHVFTTLRKKYGISKKEVISYFLNEAYAQFHTNGNVQGEEYLNEITPTIVQARTRKSATAVRDMALQVIAYLEEIGINYTAAAKEFNISVPYARKLYLDPKFQDAHTIPMDAIQSRAGRRKEVIPEEAFAHLFRTFEESLDDDSENPVTAKQLSALTGYPLLKVNRMLKDTSHNHLWTNWNGPVGEDYEMDSKLSLGAIEEIIHTLEENPLDRNGVTKLAKRFVVSRQAIYNVFANPKYAAMHNHPEITEINFTNNSQKAVAEYLTAHPESTRDEIAAALSLSPATVVHAVSRLGTVLRTERRTARGEQIPSAVLTEETAEAMLREMLDAGGKNRVEIALKYRVSPMTAYRVYTGHSWKPVWERVTAERSRSVALAS